MRGTRPAGCWEPYRSRRWPPHLGRCAAPRTAQSQRSAHSAPPRPRSLADQRIAACTGMLEFGPAARQAGRRRLRPARARLSRPRRHRPRHRRPQPGDRARARFRARLSEPRQCLVCARQLRPGDRRLRRRHQARSQFALALRQPRRRAARPRLHRRRDARTTKGDRPRRRPAPRPTAAAASFICARSDYARALADFDRALQLDAERGELHAARARRATGAGDIDRALADYAGSRRGSIRKTSPPTPRKAAIWRKKGDFDKAIAAYDRARRRRSEARRDLCLARRSLRRQRRPQARHGRHQPRASNFRWDADFLELRGDAAARGRRHRRRDARCRRHAQARRRQRRRPWRCAARPTRARRNTTARSPISTRRSRPMPTTRWPMPNAAKVHLAKNDNDRALADLNRAIELGATDGALYRARAVDRPGQGR